MMVEKETIKKDYRKRAGSYGAYIKTYKDPILMKKIWKNFLPLKKELPKKAIDLACGCGDASIILRNKGFDVSYLDLTEKMIKKGIKNGKISKNAETKIGNIEDPLPYKDSGFGLAICRYAFHDVRGHKQPELLREVRRVLAPGGKFQIIDICSPVSLSKSPEITFFYRYHHAFKTIGPPRNCWIPDIVSLKKMFKGAGFKNIKEGDYSSNVVTKEWLEEGQITKNRYEFLNRLILNHAKHFPKIKRTFKISETTVKDKEGREEKSVKMKFPVKLVTGTNPG